LCRESDTYYKKTYNPKTNTNNKIPNPNKNKLAFLLVLLFDLFVENTMKSVVITIENNGIKIAKNFGIMLTSLFNVLK